jgi:hypothetical protein
MPSQPKTAQPKTTQLLKDEPTGPTVDLSGKVIPARRLISTGGGYQQKVQRKGGRKVASPKQMNGK